MIVLLRRDRNNPRAPPLDRLPTVDSSKDSKKEQDGCQFNEEITTHLEHGNWERMPQVVVGCKDHLTILSIEVWREDDVELSVNPEQAIAIVIYHNTRTHTGMSILTASTKQLLMQLSIQGVSSVPT